MNASSFFLFDTGHQPIAKSVWGPCYHSKSWMLENRVGKKVGRGKVIERIHSLRQLVRVENGTATEKSK